MGLVNIKNNNKSEHGHEYGVINHFFTIIYSLELSFSCSLIFEITS